MDARLAKLLRIVVEDVIATGEPVGSQRIVDTSPLDVSSATIRNWFAELEEQGYLMQPHTSSGRVPTEKGWNLYLEMIRDSKALGKKERTALERAYRDADDTEQALKSTAKTIADTVSAAVVVFGEMDAYYTGLSQLFSQPEFRNWNQVMSVSEALDDLEDSLRQTRLQTFPDPVALIGSACPFGSDCSLLVVSASDDTFIGILGPLRMDYQTGLSLLRAVQQLSRN